MRSNPPVKGHELIAEGHLVARYDPVTEEGIGPDGGCRCGAKPDGWPNLSVGAVKRWHRLHKDHLRWGS